MKITFDPTDKEEVVAVVKYIKTFNYSDISELFDDDLPVTQKLSVVHESEGTGANMVPSDSNETLLCSKSVDLDANGVPWNIHFHAPGKTLTAKGLWRRAQRITKKQYDDHAAEVAGTALPPPAATATVTGVIAPPPPATVTVDLLEQIDGIFADLEDMKKIENFNGWVASMLNWVKLGANSIFDLKGDLKAQEKLFNELKEQEKLLNSQN